MTLYDHVDVRVRDLARARAFYDPLCAALGLTDVVADEREASYTAPDRYEPFLGLTVDPDHVPAKTCVAFRASDRDGVDRICAVAREAGARNVEPPERCADYTPLYYAGFFEDPDGNRYEVAFRTRPA